MQRREFISASRRAAAVAVGGARAAAGETSDRVSSSASLRYAIRLRAFRQGLKEAGYVEGQNVAIEYRWAEGQNDRLPALAAELVHRQVAVIVAGGGTPSAVAAKAATATIPIVFAVAGDPVKIGLVASLNRPGGNLTGVTNLNVELGPKAAGAAARIGAHGDHRCRTRQPDQSQCRALIASHAAAARRPRAASSISCNASTERDFDTVFATLVQLRAGALVIGPDIFFTPAANSSPR